MDAYFEGANQDWTLPKTSPLEAKTDAVPVSGFVPTKDETPVNLDGVANAEEKK